MPASQPAELARFVLRARLLAIAFAVGLASAGAAGLAVLLPWTQRSGTGLEWAVGVGLLATSIAVPLLYARLYWRVSRQEPPRSFVIGSHHGQPAFVAPVPPIAGGTAIQLAVLWAVLRIVDDLSLPSLLVAALYVALGAFWLFRRPEVLLTPAGVVVRIGRRSSEVLWSQFGREISWPEPRPSKVLWAVVDRQVRFSKIAVDGRSWLAVPLQHCLTDRRFLAAAMHYYSENSVARADIGTATGHQRLVGAVAGSLDAGAPPGGMAPSLAE